MAAVSVSLCLFFLISLISQELGAQEQVCVSCPGDLRKSSEVSQRCLSTPGARTRGRCCVLQEKGAEAIIGLDLWNCSLTRIDPTVRLTDALVVLDLSNNPLHDLPQEFFHGLTALQYVALPPTLDCPGGDDLWDSVDKNETVRTCQDQRSRCNRTTESHLLCPENSLCAPDGPGFTQCLCADGFYGYKCLREGSFPMLMFFGILSLVTVSLSLLLWFSQRRKVKSH